ncbi:MAG: hypothetical protein ACE5NW_08380 [Acidiferrobacterales bacterium]
MNSELVFTRTEKGDQEISTREHQLQQRLRTVLILVDGKSNVGELRNKAVALDELEHALEDLAIDGFIQSDSPAWDRRVGAGAGQSVGYDGVERRRNADATFTPIRARLINTAVLTFGSRAENVVKKFKDAPASWQGLEMAITDCTKLAAMVYDEKRAKEFKSKCWQILSKAVRTTSQRL